MPTADISFNSFLNKNTETILTICLREGFQFSVKESASSVTVRCTLPDSTVRFIVFDDHRTNNPHGGKPHVCNQWHKALGEPLSFTTGKQVTDAVKHKKVLLAVSIMCMTQSSAYTKMKESIFLKI
jgi:hypothetical protein